MIGHEPFDDSFTKINGSLVRNRYSLIVGNGFHARHHQFSRGIIGIAEHFNSTLTACAHRTQRGMPAEVWQIETERKTSLKQVLAGLHLVWLIIDIESYHFNFCILNADDADCL
jgi:hypothetical protein